MQKSKLTQILIHYLSDLPGKVVSGISKNSPELFFGLVLDIFNAFTTT